jgi:phosphoglycerol transferase MdoB-like AlkP superfamily enzyme
MVPSDGSQNRRAFFLDVGPIGLALVLSIGEFAWFAMRVIGVSGPTLLVSVGALGICTGAMAPLLFLPRSIRLLILFLLQFVTVSLALADSVHNRFFGDWISITEFAYAHQLAGVTSSVVRLLRPADVLYYLPVIAALLALPAYIRVARHVQSLSLRHKMFISLLLLSGGLVLTETIGRAAVRNALVYAAFSRYITPDPPASAFGPPQRERVAMFLSRRYDQNAVPSPLFGTARARNLILISAESLNAFPVHLQILGQPVMPNFATLVSESLYFDNFYDQAGGTSNAEFAALQSLHPLTGGAVSMRYSGNRFNALPHILTRQGYTTVSACGAAPTFWNMQQTHANLGFQQSYFEDSYQASEKINTWIPDIAFLEQTAARLALQSQPFMAFLLSSTNHHPFLLPAHERRLNLGPLEGTALGNYLQSVHYFDRALGAFLRALRQTGLLETSVLAIYGDHHAYISDTRPLHQLLGIAEADRLAMWLVQKNIPFLIRLPHGEHTGIIKNLGGHLDIAPTLLALLGVSPEVPMLGRDLTALGERLVIFSDMSFTDGRYYMIKSGGPVACIDGLRRANVSCEALEEKRRQASDELQTSAFILQGNLIPDLVSMTFDRDTVKK